MSSKGVSKLCQISQVKTLSEWSDCLCICLSETFQGWHNCPHLGSTIALRSHAPCTWACSAWPLRALRLGLTGRNWREARGPPVPPRHLQADPEPAADGDGRPREVWAGVAPFCLGPGPQCKARDPTPGGRPAGQPARHGQLEDAQG